MFLCWEVSFYSSQFLDADAHICEFKGLTFSMALGYTIGTFCLLPCRRSNQHLMKVGFMISFYALAPILLLYPFIGFSRPLVLVLYFIYAMGAAFLVPSLFSSLSLIRRNVHKQGIMMGLIESSDTCALLLASVVSTLFVYFLSNELISPIAMPIFSMAFMLLSLVFNRKFRQATRKKLPNENTTTY